MNIHDAALAIINAPNPAIKAALGRDLAEKWQSGEIVLPDHPDGLAAPVRIPDPGRPEQPQLVHPRDLKRRSLHSAEGRVVFMHAIAHIEFNAVNLAWDAVYRFRGQSRAYYDDWVGVALDESRHFAMVREYLVARNADYGDYPAHNGLWDMALRTDHDILVRMAMIPRVMEARGLDVTPAMIEKLAITGDTHAIEILQTIYREEIAHVEAGTRWYRHHCRIRGIDPDSHFPRLIDTYLDGSIRRPLNIEGRKAAGFSDQELSSL
jgi:uncharacterized ferritin-like protein (DUF455 family)